MNPPANAHYAEILLLYQPASWEYVQFLHFVNSGQIAFLAEEAVNLLGAWLAMGMAVPYVLATATWRIPPATTCNVPGTPQNLAATASGKKAITRDWNEVAPPPSGGYRIYYDRSGEPQFVVRLPPGTLNYRDGGLAGRVTSPRESRNQSACLGVHHRARAQSSGRATGALAFPLVARAVVATCPRGEFRRLQFNAAMRRGRSPPSEPCH